MSHFTTAVSLSGVAKTWSRSTLQSFQDSWKYPLHVFSCMCALGQGSGILDVNSYYVDAAYHCHSDDGWRTRLLSSPPAEILRVWQRTVLIGVNWSIYLLMLTLTFAEHYQRWYLFICVESQIRSGGLLGTTVKHKAYQTAAVSGCLWQD